METLGKSRNHVGVLELGRIQEVLDHRRQALRLPFDDVGELVASYRPIIGSVNAMKRDLLGGTLRSVHHRTGTVMLLGT